MSQSVRSTNLPGNVPTPTNRLVMSTVEIDRALVRIAHEIVERNHGVEDLVVVGLHSGGTRPARRIVDALEQIENRRVPLGTIDAVDFRDDDTVQSHPSQTAIDADLTGLRVVLIDDVLFTGRTVRAALYALNEFGRASAVQLAVMVDRGHRELPIRADFVGKNLPTRSDEEVEVDCDIGVSIRRRP